MSPGGNILAKSGRSPTPKGAFKMALTGSSNTQFENCLRLVLGLLFSVGLAVTAFAQSATYHLHGEASNTANLLQLKTAGPDTATVALQSLNLKNQLGEQLIKALDTQSGVPNVSGVIPAGSTITLTLWMNKTVASGVMYPRAKLQLNSAAGTLVCTATGSTALTTTLTQYTLSATTSSNVSMTTSDRFYIWVGVNVATKATAITNASLSIEGTLNGNYDSFAVIPTPVPPSPPPAITGISPATGPVGSSVTITGSSFGTTQGTSTVKFNGVATTPTSWNATSIVAPVPASATTGPVIVTVAGQASNSIVFTIVPRITTLAPDSGAAGTSVVISGTTFGTTQGASTVTFNGVSAAATTWSDTSIVTSVPSGATTGPVIVTAGGQPSNGVTFTVTAPGQTPTTYHLHKEASNTTSLFQLKTAAPDSASTAVQSIELKSLSAGEYIVKAFDTQSGIPNATGVIPANSIVSFTVWMKKTADFGEMNPLVKLFLNNANGTPVCSTTDIWMPLTLFISKHTLPCTLASEISVNSTDRFYLWVGVNMTYGPGANRVKAELDIEGTLDGNYDSQVTVPALVQRPTITNLSPASGSFGTSVVITGNNFRDSQDNNIVTFNGSLAIPATWNNTTIVVPVPGGATSGPVAVTINGVKSNTINFDVVAGTISGTITAASSGQPVAGAIVESLQAGGVRGAARTRSGGTYSLTGLNGGIYDVRVSADGYATELRTGLNVSAGSTTIANIALIKVGAISGVVTQANGTTAIAGATVKFFQGSILVGKAITSGSGSYSVQQLKPGSYMVQATAPAYESQNQTGVIVSEQATTTVNFSLSSGIASSSVRYVYDESGRLVIAANQAGETAKYLHDSVGNLTSITRHSPGQVSILEFTPNSGVEGGVVTISGSGFSSTPTENTLSFNGTAAVITSASNTQLVTTVPAGATTGLITVVTPSGSAASSSPFIIDNNQPTIVDFNPKVGDPGTAVTISGTNFESTLNGNQVSFSTYRSTVTAAASNSLIANAPPTGSTSGRISVNTPRGKAVSTQDFFITPKIPEFCCYSAADIEYTGRMSIGESKVITINTANKIGLIVFDAKAGQRVSFDWTNVTINSSAVRIYFPDGTVFGAFQYPTTFYVGAGGGFFPSTILSNLGQPYSTALPMTGTYTIVVDPESTYVGSLRLTLGEIPPDNTYTIFIGGPSKDVTLSVPGQNAQVFFTGLAGERIATFVTNSNIPWRDLSIYDPNGRLLPNMFRLTVDFNEIPTLPMSGTYMIVVSALGRYTGSETLTLYDIPPDINTTILPNGPTVTVTTTAPGQNARLTFNGTAGQRISLKMGSGTLPVYFPFIFNPDGSALISSGVGFDTSGGFFDVQTLPANGVYTIVVDGFRQYTGSVPLTLYLVPPDVTGTTTINGSASNLATTVPGQNGLVTFSGSASQQVTVRITNNSLGEVTVNLLNPDGSLLTTSTSGSASFNLAASTLPTAGTYKVSVDPIGSNIGNISVTVTSP
jgi:hypothetical protein